MPDMEEMNEWKRQIRMGVLDELHRAVCVIGIITDRDGHDLIWRDSVLDLIDQRRFRQ